MADHDASLDMHDEITPPRGVVYRPWQPVAGPVDRVSFFEEQRRHRRATWRLTFFCTLAVLLTGIPVSLVMTPVVYTLALLLLTLSGQFVAVPEAVWQLTRSTFLTILETMEEIGRQPLTAQVPRLTLMAVLLLLPGVAAMGLLWLWLGRAFARSGAGGILLSLGARDPRTDDLEERQLANVVEEMAIAAGLPPPRLMLLDSDVANAAAIGSSPTDATVLVSRRLLDEIDRDDTQGVLAHLIGSIGNGDLRIALTVVRLFQTLGLAMSILFAPVSSKARATLWDLVQSARGGGRSEAGARETDLILSLLMRDLSDVDMDDVDKVLGDDSQRVKGLRSVPLKIRVFGLFPLWFAAGLAKVVMMMLTSFLLEPALAHLWRTRKFLADATAVQLTRDPDGLASALTVLERSGGVLRGGRWAAHLFIVGSEVSECRQLNRLARTRESVRGWKDRIAAGRRAQQEMMADLQEQEATSMTGEGQSIVNFHPPLDKRLERLRALGTSNKAAGPRPSLWGGTADLGMKAVFILVIGPLSLIAIWLGLIALGMMMALVLGAVFIYLAIIFAIFSAFR